MPAGLRFTWTWAGIQLRGSVPRPRCRRMPLTGRGRSVGVIAVVRTDEESGGLRATLKRSVALEKQVLRRQPAPGLTPAPGGRCVSGARSRWLIRMSRHYRTAQTTQGVNAHPGPPDMRTRATAQAVTRPCLAAPRPDGRGQTLDASTGTTTPPFDAPVVAWARVCFHTPRPRGGRSRPWIPAGRQVAR